MADVAPFHGIRFHPSIDPAAVTSPPYDVITSADRVALEAASPHNVVRLDLGPIGDEDKKYSRAAALLGSMLEQGVLVRDEEPSLYVYDQSFEAAGGRRRQIGVFAAVEISEEILPHERTMGPVVEDRLAVIRTLQANVSPVFCLYWSPEPGAGGAAIQTAARSAPYADFVSADGIRNRAWRVPDPATIEAFAKTLASATVMIADGHHRFRTAQAYRDQRRAADGEGPWARTLLYLVDGEGVDGESGGPMLLPIHRLVRGVDPAAARAAMSSTFELEPAEHDAGELAAAVAGRRPAGRCYGILAPDGAWIATLRNEADARAATEGDHCRAWRDLDVAVLHTLLFDRILDQPEVTYCHHPHEAAGALAAGEASLAVLMAPTPVSAVRDVALARDSMPSKSTFFVPKPRTGLVIRSLR